MGSRFRLPGSLEERRWNLHAFLAQLLDHPRHDTSRDELADHPPALAAGAPEREEILHHRRQAFETGDIRHRLDAPDAVVLPAHLDYYVNRRHDLTSHRARGQL